MYKKRKCPRGIGVPYGSKNRTCRLNYISKQEKSQLLRDILFGVVGTLILFGGLFGIMWLHSVLIKLIGG